MPSYTASPTSFANAGTGILWQLPSHAVGTGIGSQIPMALIGFSIASNVITVTLPPPGITYTAGQVVTISGMIHNTFLNGAVLTVLPTGLSATQFQANYTFAGSMSATDSGIVTPSTTYTLAQNMDQAITPPPGQYTAFAMIEGPWFGIGSVSSNQLGCACVYEVSGQNCGGGGGGSLNPPLFSTSPNPTIPTLPPGAVVTGIYGIALSGKSTVTGSFVGLQAFYTGGSTDYLMTGSWESTGTLGTNLSILSTAYFALTIQATLTCIGGYGGSVQSCGFAITYSLPSGTPTPSTQLQTLEGTNCGFSVPNSSVVTGVEVDFKSGIAAGTSCTLDFQLTLNGSPVGSIKTLTVGSWATAYALGGSSDLWGTGGLTPAQVNGSTGIGVNVFGTLADASEVRLNSLSITISGTVIVRSSIPVVWVNVGNTMRPNV